MSRALRPLDSPLVIGEIPAGAVLDRAAIFGRSAPLQVDLGCGDGAFLVEMARRFPEQDFLGMERLFRRSGSACRRAERLGLRNVRILRGEIDAGLGELLGAGSVHSFHVLFPDPWPKRRHHRRRLLQPAFLHVLHGCLADGGEVRFRTDDEPYFQQVASFAAAGGGFEVCAWEVPEDYPGSAFQRRFEARGLPVFSLRLVKR